MTDDILDIDLSDIYPNAIKLEPSVHRERVERCKEFFAWWDLPEGVWIAGGAVRDTVLNEPYKDIDVFGKSEEALEAFMDLNSVRLGSCEYEGDRATTFQMDAESTRVGSNGRVQVVTGAFYPDMTALLKDFDFTICQFGWDGKDVYHMYYGLDHLETRTLALAERNGGPHTPVSSLRRVVRFAERGFKTEMDTFNTLVMAVAKLGPDEAKKFLTTGDY